MNGVAGYQAGQDLIVRVTDFDGYIATLDSPSLAEGQSGTSSLVFTVTLDRVALVPVTVSYQTVPGASAQAGSDYVAASGQIVIPAGQQSAQITITVNGDAVPEGFPATK